MTQHKLISNYSQLLCKLGFSLKEVKIYLWLLSSGPSSISKIAEELSVPRTTVHENIEKLKRVGLISKAIKGTKKKIIAEPPSKLELILAQKKIELKIQQENIKKIEKEIPNFVQSIENINQNINFDVKVYKGEVKIRRAYDEIFSCNEMRSFVSTDGIDALFPENYEKFRVAHARNVQMRVWEIFLYKENKFVNKYDKKRYFYKIAPVTLHTSIPVDFIIFDTKVAIINLTESPTCIIINNDAFCLSMKSLFEFIWIMISSKNR